jgi:putative ABC transport system permease protein
VTDHEAEMRAAWFVPYHQDPTGPSGDQIHIMVRASDAAGLDALRRAVQQVDPALATYGATTMEALQRERVSQDRLGALLSGAFAVFGLVLAGCSLYGMLSYAVDLRTAEIGVRMALGAGRGSIIGLVLRQAGGRLLAGVLAGVMLALAVNQLLRTMVEGLAWVSLPSVLGLAGLLAVITAVAAAVPALRATRVDPVRCLRG